LQPHRRICLGKRRINVSTVFAGQTARVKEAHDGIWLVSFMDYVSGPDLLLRWHWS